MKTSYAAFAALSLISAPAFAQVAPAASIVLPAAPVAAPIAPLTTGNAVLRAGTPLSLKMMEEVTTKKKAAKVGQRFQLEVAAPVEINGVTVIPAGTPAWGEITEVRNKGMWGKSGKLTAQLLFLRVNGRQIRLKGTFDDKGVTGTAGVVGAVAFIPVAGFFLTGTSAKLPLGGAVGGFIDEDVELAIAAAAPAPMVVPMPTPAPQAAPAATPVVTPAVIAASATPSK